MPTDRRPPDTEAIRAARSRAEEVLSMYADTQAGGGYRDVRDMWRDMKPMAEDVLRFVAQLEAVERERDEAREDRWDAVNKMLAARAALAAAAPGETEQTP